MTGIEKIRKLLCTCEDVEKDLMQLRFGTDISWVNNNGVEVKDRLISIISDDNGGEWVRSEIRNVNVPFFNDKIIGNPIEERHIMMYCEENDIHLERHPDGSFYQENSCIPVFKLDNTKPINLQSNQVIEDIVKYLTDNK